MARLPLISACLFLSALAQEVDSLPAYALDTIRIQDIRTYPLRAAEMSVDKVQRLLPATQLVYRSVPFAQEVVYQGFLPQQTQVTIEGMRILPACVDRMDPVLTFIEGPAVESANWQTVHNWGATPTLSVSLFSPEGSSQGDASLILGDNYHRLFFSVRQRQHLGRLSTASAVTFRLGSDYRTGRSFSPGVTYNRNVWGKDSTYDIAPFRKINLYTALRYNLSSHAVEVAYLGDYFYDVYYPALIMDARHSAMHLVSLRHVWKESSELRIYANTIFHDMTDETRSETEIRNRIVMPGMYMPMKGLTRTAGAIWKARWWDRSGFQLEQRSEYSYSTAYGSMEMSLLAGGVPMRLLNLADIRFQQGGSTLSLAYKEGTWSVRAEGRYHVFAYEVGDKRNYLPLRGYQESYGGGSDEARRFSVYEVALAGSWSFAGHHLLLSISQGTRAPTHTELYAYYLYVPMDNSIQMGNSLLRPEKLLRGEIEYHYTRGRVAYRIAAFGNRMEDYITPVTFLLPGAPGNSTRQQWRILQNTGKAYTAGFTLRGSLHLGSSGLLEGTTGYAYGWHETLREPLPWIYPLFGRVRYTHRYGRHWGSIEWYGAAAQSHLSRTIYIEDYTPAYWLLHLRYGLRLWEKDEHTGITLTASVENLLNTYGWDHLSVGNMPFLGRVVRIGVVAEW